MRALPLLALAALVVPTGARAADLSSLYYEREVMREADARCNLFAPRLGQALQASALMMRSAAMRAGTAAAALDATAAQARAKVEAVACTSPDLRIAAQRVRAAFIGWSHQATLDLPGRRSAWAARRWPLRAGPYWTLSTPARLGDAPATLGLRRDDSHAPDRLSVWIAGPQAARAYALRLVMRDPSRAADPYLAAAPPPGAQRAFLASERAAAPEGGVLFRLPAAAVAALAGLDPRETVRLELATPAGRGERTQTGEVEVGDFAAGQAFLAAGG